MIWTYRAVSSAVGDILSWFQHAYGVRRGVGCRSGSEQFTDVYGLTDEYIFNLLGRVVGSDRLGGG